MQEVTAEDMSDLESGEEDGQMVLRSKRYVWWTATKTVAFAVLDSLKHIEERSQLYFHV